MKSISVLPKAKVALRIAYSAVVPIILLIIGWALVRGKVLWVIGIISAIALGGYAVSLFMQAKDKVDESPTAAMFICPTHGAMFESGTVNLFNSDMDMLSPDGRTIRGPSRMCAICLEERIERAKKQAGV